MLTARPAVRRQVGDTFAPVIDMLGKFRVTCYLFKFLRYL